MHSHSRCQFILRRLSILFGLVLSTGQAFANDDKAATIVPAAEAKNHVGETCTVELTVRSSKNAAPRKEIYLDSEEDFRDEKNLAIVISYDHLDQFKSEGISDPADHYKDKKIQVTGKVIQEADQTRVRVTEPSQIKLTEAGK